MNRFSFLSFVTLVVLFFLLYPHANAQNIEEEVFYNGATCEGEASVLYYTEEEGCVVESCNGGTHGSGGAINCLSDWPVTTDTTGIYFAYYSDSSCTGNPNSMFAYPGDGVCRAMGQEGYYVYATCAVGGAASAYTCTDSACTSCSAVTAGNSCGYSSSGGSYVIATCPSESGSDPFATTAATTMYSVIKQYVNTDCTGAVLEYGFLGQPCTSASCGSPVTFANPGSYNVECQSTLPGSAAPGDIYITEYDTGSGCMGSVYEYITFAPNTCLNNGGGGFMIGTCDNGEVTLKTCTDSACSTGCTSVSYTLNQCDNNVYATCDGASLQASLLLALVAALLALM